MPGSDADVKLLPAVPYRLTLTSPQGVPATFDVFGLHPERVEFLTFHQDVRRLIGTISPTWTDEPVRVVMRPAATLKGGSWTLRATWTQISACVFSETE